jgi:hypothetical protein
VAWRSRGRRGRPRKANAKRRATTLAGRAPAPDRGTDQLRLRKLRLANGSAMPVELGDVAGALFANGFILPEELLASRLVASWLKSIRIAYVLRQEGPAALCAALQHGTSGRGPTVAITPNDYR